jgi:hypothetical protein
MDENKRWTRQELLLALNLYFKIPFGQYHRDNIQVRRLAEVINRTPSAVAMKLSNFASLDDNQRQRGVMGLPNVSKADRELWHEFASDRATLVPESERLFEDAMPESEIDGYEPLPEDYSTDVERLIIARRGQRFFRGMILANYNTQCCICGIPIRQLLIASHIIPWRERADLRLNPHNGLCFCALHDKAFDAGLLTLDEQYRILISSEIDDYLPQHGLENAFRIYHLHPMTLPEKYLPHQEFLDFRRTHIFMP